MNKAICLVASDNHLTSSKVGVMKYKDYDTYFPFMQIYDYAINRNLPVILAGDVFDKRILDPLTYFAAKICIESLNKTGNKTYFVQGQHEYNDLLPWLSTIEGTVYLNNRTEKIDPLNVYGLDYSYQKEYYEDQISTIPEKADVLVTHYTWKDLIFSKEASLIGFDFVAKNAKHLKLVITGDYHDQIVKKIDNTIFFSPGSTTLRSINEPIDKYFYELVEENGEIKINPIKLIVRPCIFLVICKKEVKQRTKYDKHKPKLLDKIFDDKKDCIVLEYDDVSDNNFNETMHSKILTECKLAIMAEHQKFTNIYHQFMGQMYNSDMLEEKEKLMFEMNRNLFDKTGVSIRTCPKLFSPNLYIIYDIDQRYTVNTIMSELENLCFVKCINIHKDIKTKQVESDNKTSSNIDFESVIDEYLQESKLEQRQKSELVKICKDLWIAEDKNSALTNIINNIVTDASKEGCK